MGTWNTGFLDNDTAMDFIGNLFNNALTEGMFDEQLLALAHLQMKHVHFIDEYLVDIYIEQINKELDNLDNWKEDSREERKRVLEKLKSKIENQDRYDSNLKQTLIDMVLNRCKDWNEKTDPEKDDICWKFAEEETTRDLAIILKELLNGYFK